MSYDARLRVRPLLKPETESDSEATDSEDDEDAGNAGSAGNGKGINDGEGSTRGAKGGSIAKYYDDRNYDPSKDSKRTPVGTAGIVPSYRDTGFPFLQGYEFYGGYKVDKVRSLRGCSGEGIVYTVDKMGRVGKARFLFSMASG